MCLCIESSHAFCALFEGAPATAEDTLPKKTRGRKPRGMGKWFDMYLCIMFDMCYFEADPATEEALSKTRGSCPDLTAVTEAAPPKAMTRGTLFSIGGSSHFIYMTLYSDLIIKFLQVEVD